MGKVSDNGGAAAEAVGETKSGGEETEETVEEIVGD